MLFLGKHFESLHCCCSCFRFLPSHQAINQCFYDFKAFFSEINMRHQKHANNLTNSACQLERILPKRAHLRARRVWLDIQDRCPILTINGPTHYMITSVHSYQSGGRPLIIIVVQRFFRCFLQEIIQAIQIVERRTVRTRYGLSKIIFIPETSNWPHHCGPPLLIAFSIHALLSICRKLAPSSFQSGSEVSARDARASRRIWRRLCPEVSSEPISAPDWKR